jgi:hypothetical protein
VVDVIDQFFHRLRNIGVSDEYSVDIIEAALEAGDVDGCRVVEQIRVCFVHHCEVLEGDSILAPELIPKLEEGVVDASLLKFLNRLRDGHGVVSRQPEGLVFL